jgi:peptide methionine sulfoxide reductase MsrA
METATFAADGLEGAFRAVAGVRDVRVGSIEPAYEAVELDYDPWQISYNDLLAVFWAAHDPTRPGSAIFPHTAEQHGAAEASRRSAEKRLGPVATEIVAAGRFLRRAPS